MEEIATLAGKIPHIDAGLDRPHGDPVNWLTCKNCRKASMVKLTGKGKPWLCLACDAERIEKHVAKFEALIRDAVGQTPCEPS